MTQDECVDMLWASMRAGNIMANRRFLSDQRATIVIMVADLVSKGGNMNTARWIYLKEKEDSQSKTGCFRVSMEVHEGEVASVEHVKEHAHG